MSNAEEIPARHDEPAFIVGASGRLPRRTICAIELDETEVAAQLHKWRSLLGDRLNAAKPEQLPHPSRIVKREHAATMRRLTGLLADFSRLHVIHMPKQHAEQSRREILNWLTKLLDGRPSGLALLHDGDGTSWYRLTAEGSVPLSQWALPHCLSEAELLLTPAKLAAYASYQHRCYPSPGCRPSWLPLELPWTEPAIPTGIRT
ncbi:hypothetical protein [Streptomyces sp. MN13]